MLIQECAQLDSEGKPWIQTASGRPFPIGDPKPEDFCLRDIGHHLSRLNRYTGAIKTEFYTVAEHSVRVAYYLRALVVREKNAGLQDQRDAFKAGLMHDAHEAYLNDLNSPLKKHMLNEGHTGYAKLAAEYDQILSDRYDLCDFRAQSIDLIHEADLSLLDLERPRVMGPPPRPWSDLAKLPKIKNFMPKALNVWGWRPNVARARFYAAAKLAGLRLDQ